ncbi:MAG TPA: CHAD domain-containing protein [Candidatus Nitrosotalea sp.]|jgi:CHAD domain-containing protein|nr:CHAD domain-containing protein [Candidatus Nitrosotalea sp.]
MPSKSSSLEYVLAALQSQLEAVHAYEPGVRAGRDPEDLRKMRVAVRRLRAILRASRSLLDRQWVKSLRRELDWLGTSLGRVRDLDTLRAYLDSEIDALEGTGRKAAQALLQRVETDRARALDALHAALDAPRYARLLIRLKTAVAEPQVGREDVSLPDVAAKEFKRLRRAVKLLSSHPSADDLHAVRILVKRARYAAELARTTAGRRAKKFIDEAKTVQDILGEHQDAVVIEKYLHDVIDSREAAHALEQQLLRRQRKRRKKARAAFLEEWPSLERRGRKAWATAS